MDATMRFKGFLALAFISASICSAGAQDFRAKFDQCAQKQDNLERLACYDLLRTPVFACSVSGDEAKRDALRFGTLLRAGDPLFATDFGTYYGHTGPKVCALRPMMEALAKVVPEDVSIESEPAKPMYGYMNGDFQAEVRSKTAMSYAVNVWRLVSSGLVEEIKLGTLTPSKANPIIRKNVDPRDMARFVEDFNRRKNDNRVEAALDDRGIAYIRLAK